MLTGARGAQTVSLAALVLWIAFTVVSILAAPSALNEIATFGAIVALFAFALAHSMHRLRLKATLVLFVTGAIIANIYENLSISTGFPFGSYHHTHALGPWLLQVPIVVGPIFYSLCYLAWTLATMIVGPAETKRSTIHTFGLPVVGAFIATGWDICSDPIGATVARNWVFAHSGAYYGVPLSNYIGWFVCTWTIIQCWTLYLRYADGEDAAAHAPASYWYQAAGLWAALGLQYSLLLLATSGSQTVTDTGGWAWRSGDVLQASAMMGFYMLVAVAVMAALAVASRNQTRPAG